MSCHSESDEDDPTELEKFASPRQDITQYCFNLDKLVRSNRQRRCQLDDGVTSVIGTALKSRLKQSLGKESTQELFRFFFGKGFLGFLVLYQLDAK